MQSNKYQVNNDCTALELNQMKKGKKKTHGRLYKKGLNFHSYYT